MKRRAFHTLTILLLFSITINSYSQIENIELAKGIEADRFYLGLLSYSSVSTNNLEHDGRLSLQGGTRFHFSVIPGFVSFRSFGVFRITDNEKVKTFTNFESIITPHEKLAIHLGVMATPTTELRPNPTTWQSQVETKAESGLPGGRPGIKVKYALTKKLNISYGVHNQRSVAAQHLKFAYDNFSIATFSRKGKVSFAAKWVKDYCKVIVSIQGSEIVYSTILPAAFGLLMQTDVVYSTKAKKTTFTSYALRKYFESEKYLKGFFSIGYNATSNQFEGGFFLHI